MAQKIRAELPAFLEKIVSWVGPSESEVVRCLNIIGSNIEVTDFWPMKIVNPEFIYGYFALAIWRAGGIAVPLQGSRMAQRKIDLRVPREPKCFLQC